MKGLFRVAGFFAVLVVLGFVAFRILIGGSTVSWNQRLTVIVDTPAGVVTGASVVAVSETEIAGPMVLMEARGARSGVRGEAVATETPSVRYLIALMSGDGVVEGRQLSCAYTLPAPMKHVSFRCVRDCSDRAAVSQV
jgi:hypothetical protein